MIFNYKIWILVLTFIISLNMESLSQKNSIKLLGFKSGTCDESYINPYRIKNRIITIDKVTDTVFLEVRISANCCSKFKGEVELKLDTILNLKYSETNDNCACQCGFSLYYIFNCLEFNKITQFELNGQSINESGINDFDHYEQIKYANGKTKSFKLYEKGILKLEISYDSIGGITDSVRYKIINMR